MLSKNFARSEFACKCGCGYDTVDAELIAIVQAARDRLGALIINSGCRCAYHNKSVGGASKSLHLLGRAADVRPLKATPKELYDWVIETHPRASVILYNTFVHIDTRSGKAYRP